MTEKHPLVAVHQLRIFLRGTSPHVWRRIVIPRHFTLTQLRQTINFLFGWSNAHPCGFVIRGKSFPSDPVVNAGRNFCTGADTVTVDESATPQTLSEFQFYPRERFLYNYRFERQTAVWQHEIRVEKTLSSQPTEAFPRCIAGAGSSIPAPVASPQELQHMQGLFTTGYILHRLTELIDDGASEQRLAAELRYLRPWLTAGQFSSGEVNRQLECLSGAAL